MLACKSFKKSGSDLCTAIATMTRRLCTEYMDPLSTEATLANRLIPLDKGEGAVRPIGVGEVIRRIIAKCVISLAYGTRARSARGGENRAILSIICTFTGNRAFRLCVNDIVVDLPRRKDATKVFIRKIVLVDH